jgi:Glutathione S-transferase, N-terminal domain
MACGRRCGVHPGQQLKRVRCLPKIQLSKKIQLSRRMLMKLYFAPGACSLSPHIVLREAGYNFELEQVNNAEKKTKSGKDYWSINGKGQVPVLELDTGERLTEGPAIVQYLADQKPAAGLAPAAGVMDRYRVQEWLNFIGTELHKTFGPIFRPTTRQAFRLARQAACRPHVSCGRQVQHRRCLSVHRAALVAADRDRPREVA